MQEYKTEILEREGERFRQEEMRIINASYPCSSVGKIVSRIKTDESPILLVHYKAGENWYIQTIKQPEDFRYRSGMLVIVRYSPVDPQIAVILFFGSDNIARHGKK